VIRPRVVLAVLALAVSTTAFGQPRLESSLGGALASFLAPGEGPELRGSFAGQLLGAYDFDAGRGRIHYSLDGGSYGTPGDWGFLRHELGLGYRFALGATDRVGLSLGGSAQLRDNGASWSHADYRGLSGWLVADLQPRPTAALRLGYRLDQRRFPELSPLDQLEHGLSLNGRLNLPSRTTLIGEAAFGLKSYQGELTTSPELVSLVAGWGQGRGRGMGPGLRTSAVALSPAGDRARLWAGLLRVAQSLGEQTGLRLQAGLRRVAGQTPPALVTTPEGFFDDGVYDDPYASDQRSLLLAVKRIFSGGAEVEAVAGWRDRDYVSAVALAEDGLPQPGEPLRADEIVHARLLLTQPVLAGRTGPVALDLLLAYDLTRHHSNDAFYNYTSHAVSVTVRGSGLDF